MEQNEILDEMYPINIEQGRDLQFIYISGSPSIDDEHDAPNVGSKDKRKFACEQMDGSDIWEATYKFERPILVRGYILETANVDPESDPKDWKIVCKDIMTKHEIVIHTVTGEETRERWNEKEYRIDDDKRPVWTDHISIRVTALQDDS